MKPIQTNRLLSWKGITGAILALVLLAGCAPATPVPPTPAPSPVPTAAPTAEALSADEIATLSSLEQVDDFPLYTMRYTGAYTLSAISGAGSEAAAAPVEAGNTCPALWGCSLFATLNDPGSRLYGRNFDWRPSPALLIFTDPPDGYASVAMVDIDYLGFEGSGAQGLADLPLEARRALLDAPAIPFDGMNAAGLAIGMAAVPDGNMQPDPQKETRDQLGVMRDVLDHAGTVEAAIEILGSYNIDMGSVPVHYLVASAAGDSALVEFYQGKMVVFRNQQPWQLATNFLVASTGGETQGQCHRYDRISQRLEETEGRLPAQEALSLLAEVAQESGAFNSSTQWSVVYDLTGGEVSVIMGRKFAEEAHTLPLDLAGP